MLVVWILKKIGASFLVPLEIRVKKEPNSLSQCPAGVQNSVKRLMVPRGKRSAESGHCIGAEWLAQTDWEKRRRTWCISMPYGECIWVRLNMQQAQACFCNQSVWLNIAFLIS